MKAQNADWKLSSYYTDFCSLGCVDSWCRADG